MKLTYNAPFILTFTFISALVLVMNDVMQSPIIMNYFTVYSRMPLNQPLTYWRLVSHVIGHANLQHFLNNFIYILLLGPMLEEKYSSGRLFRMAIITALITGLINNFLFTTALLGASGIVFMLILLSSFANFRAGTIPLTFILILFLFLGQEIFRAFEQNKIAEFAHIVGGICGSIFGFSRKK